MAGTALVTTGGALLAGIAYALTTRSRPASPHALAQPAAESPAVLAA